MCRCSGVVPDRLSVAGLAVVGLGSLEPWAISLGAPVLLYLQAARL